MEFERIIPQTGRRVNAEKIAEYCRRLADVLVNKSWHLDDVLGAHVQREIKRVVTLSESIGPAELKTARTIRVTADFWADKEEADFDEEDVVTHYEPHYKIRAALSEEVDATELPEWVLEALRKQPTFQKKRSTPEGDGVLFDESESEPELDPEMLDVFMYEKTTAMHYVLDDEGWIEDFGVVCQYECNGQFIDAREYSWSADAVETIEQYSDGVDLDFEEDATQSALSKLTESEIEQFGAQFDQVMQQILDDEKRAQYDEAFARFEEIEARENYEESARAHYSRAFGMLALNAARFIGMRIK